MNNTENIAAKVNITITEDDIDWVESIMPGIRFDKDRRDIIKCMDTVDINACPGSGKTTLLVAKLAIMAQKWSDSTKGICVLSHTNAARIEIEDKLGKTTAGKKLLSYPHFIGTFQAFFDEFVVIPQLKSKGFDDITVDTEIVTASRWHRLNYKTKIRFEHLYGNQYSCELTELPDRVNVSDKEKFKSITQEVQQIVKASMDNGDFTYNEMQLLAEYYVNERVSLQSITRWRFPYLFIDEAQDTKDFFWKLIDTLFGNKDDSSSEIIRQSYGDVNQEIFNVVGKEEENTGFPNGNILKIMNSRRFIPKIASLANGVAFDGFSTMTGEYKEFSNDIKQTVFLYQSGKASEAIRSFGHRILTSFTDEEIQQHWLEGCHIVGMVHNKAEVTPKNEQPRQVRDYYPDYDPNFAKANNNTLIDYFYQGREEYKKTNELSSLVKCASNGIWKLIKRYPSAAFESQRHRINNTLYTLCELIDTDANESSDFRKFLYLFIKSNWERESIWDFNIKQLLVLLKEHIDFANATKADYIKWHEFISNVDCGLAEEQTIDNAGKESLTSAGKNVVRYTENGRNVQMEFSSIHAVKGKTHLATMVLETKWHEYNMQSILKWLYGDQGKSRKRNNQRLKCQYVAMTRARGLVCLAIPAEFVNTEERQKLVNFGWNVEEI